MRGFGVSLVSVLGFMTFGCSSSPSASAQPDLSPQNSQTESETVATAAPPVAPPAQDQGIYSKRQIRGRERQVFTADFSKIDHPSSVESFNSAFHTDPTPQQKTGTCWAFAGTSFVESEIHRMNGQTPRLSQMYSVYWEYVEKTRLYVQTKGESNFSEGSESDSVVLRVKDYGVVPAEAYTGLLPGQTEHRHGPMRKEIWAVIRDLKKRERWDEKRAIAKVRKILDKHLGKPPEAIEVDGKKITPQEYAASTLKFPADDYASFISFKYLPFFTQGEHKVYDNWWSGDHYHNLPLDDWYKLFRDSVKQGYTVSLCGDTSEPGDGTEEDISIVPTFDLPQEFINQDAREYRFDHGTTSDDHCIHAIGYQDYKGEDWFLIKDSGSKAYDGDHKGYYFYRGDYVRLKMLVFTVHKDAARTTLAKFPAPTAKAAKK